MEPRPKEIPPKLTVLPLRNTVAFPGITIPLSVGREKTLAAIHEAGKRDNLLAILAQRDGYNDDPGPEDLHLLGTVCRIVKIQPMGDGSMNVTVHGLRRFHVKSYTAYTPYIEVETEAVEERTDDPEKVRSLAQRLKEMLGRFGKLAENVPAEVAVLVEHVQSPSLLADHSAYFLRTTMTRKQEVLAEPSVAARLEMMIDFIGREIEVIEASKRIKGQVKEQFKKSQREMILREQLKNIRKELGESGEKDEEILDLQKAVKKARMPEYAEKAAFKELERLGRSSPMSAEYGMLRTYIEWLVELPWSRTSQDHFDLERAQKILDEDHYGLEKVKKRIVEFLAVRKLKESAHGPILCLVGPPGVGKTSLGKSVARALERKVARVSLGGVRDEAEIRGHRRTYVGALPGRIIQGLKKAGTNNPVFILDEIDKLGTDFRGDPASAMLEVLDPEQNSTFQDHYLGLAFDLSKVLFICTANRMDTVPHALRDRMEVVEMTGYTATEKRHIARTFLWPRAVEDHGLTPDHIEITDAALDRIIADYTREAGVRQLGREIAALCRRVARDVAVGVAEKVTVDGDRLTSVLGPTKHIHEVAGQTPQPGVSTGLVWTPMGGDILFIEARRWPGKGEFILTGQLGDVMKESAQAALTWIRSRAGDLKIDPEDFKKFNIHVHVPSGAVPKDGPSAGIALLVALVGLLSGRPVPPEIALTGEITLRGQIMPIGGLKEKLLAAQRAGIKTVLIPTRNEKDLPEIPEEIRAGLKIITVDEAREVVRAIFGEFSAPSTSPEPGVAMM